MRPLPRWAAVGSTLYPTLRRIAPWLLPAVAGALLFAVFGTVPSRLDRTGTGGSEWVLPDLPDRAATAAEAAAVWVQRHPWGGAPPAEDPAAAAAAAAPVPVAIVSTASGHEAVFVIPGAGEVRTRAGDTLPDGGRVEQVDALSVAWIDGQGQRQEQQMLADPPRQLQPIP
ncbi:hypothetical protein E5843_03500 [Luteimonas yindakuii]|uniref:hypothetical protein n=1 Tax=Luteimonas yindakuii TaxID=2565782 RepID=UPI0010A2B91A|nr:hypothetical protein [Luteimonas yindakuii]QCO67077.1 hypothetical protein E5843_03500 [Luteimonas yindakuii]